MILAVNIGNTNIRCAVGAKEHNRQAILPIMTIYRGEDFTRSFEKQVAPGIWPLLQGSIISSVVPDKTSIVAEAIRQKTNKPPHRIDVSKCNIDISGYKGRPGEDRIVCCAAALEKYAPPIIVVDLGTATTVNFINSEGIFLGGAILAGVQMGLNALSVCTALLPQVNDFSSAPIIGTDTRENLLSGAVIGAVSAIEGYISRTGTRLGGTPKVIITGGNAPMILPHCGFDFVYEPSLLLDGLFTLYKLKECTLNEYSK